MDGWKKVGRTQKPEKESQKPTLLSLARDCGRHRFIIYLDVGVFLHEYGVRGSEELFRAPDPMPSVIFDLR